MSFSKGESPNPDGRKVEAAVRRAARTEAEKSIAALAAVRDDPGVPTELKAQAAIQILALANFKTASPFAHLAPAA